MNINILMIIIIKILNYLMKLQSRLYFTIVYIIKILIVVYFLLDNFWDFLKEEVTCKNKPLLFSSILFSSINKQINNYQFTSIEDLKQFEIDTINEICPNNDNPKLVEIKQLGYELINYINNKIN